MGKYLATPPSLSDGMVTETLVDSAGNLRVTSGTGAAASQVQGNVASGATDSGNPVKVGGVANGSANNPTAVTAGQRVNGAYSLYGDQRVEIGGSNLIWGSAPQIVYPRGGDGNYAYPLAVANWSYNGSNYVPTVGDGNGLVTQPALSSAYWSYAAASGGIVSITADVTVKAAAGAGVRNYLSGISISHDLLSAVTEFVIKDGDTVVYRGRLQTPAVDGSAGAGTIKFDPPLRGTANTALNFALLTSVTGGVYVNAQGYTGT